MKSKRILKNLTSLILIIAMLFYISAVALASEPTSVEEEESTLSQTVQNYYDKQKTEEVSVDSSNSTALAALATLPTTAASALNVSSSANTPYFTSSYTLNAGQAGYVKLTGENFNASVYTTGSIDLSIEIYSNQACTNLVTSDDDSGHGLNPKVYFYVAKDQTYYLKVKGYSSSTSGSFTFVIHRGQPTSRSEKSDMFTTYNSSTYQPYTNCYTYALSYYVNPKTGKKFRDNGQNPGEMAGSAIVANDLANASTAKAKIEAALTKDFNYFGGSWAEISETDQPREGYFKVALVLSPGIDYHWYRELPNGQWGHKPSTDPARLTDASGYLIYQPQSQNRNFLPTYPNYSVFIAFYEFKIPAGAAPTAASSTSAQDIEQKTYPIKYDLTLDVVKTLTNGTSTESAMEVLGQPNHYFGSGMVGSVYELVDGTEVTVYFSNGVIDQIRIYHTDASYEIIVQ